MNNAGNGVRRALTSPTNSRGLLIAQLIYKVVGKMGIKNFQNILDAMRAAKCTPEQILAAIDYQAGLEADRLKEHRAKRAEQKRNERARKADMSPNVAATDDMSQRQHDSRSDPLSLNGFPPAPIYKNNTPPSLNPISSIRPKPLEGFDLFWSAYPRREGKGRAEKAWSKAIRLAAPEKIVEAVKATKWSDDKQFVPLPATWLNDRRWEDELPGMVHRISKEEFEEQERKRIAYLMDLAKKTDRSFQ